MHYPEDGAGPDKTGRPRTVGDLGPHTRGYRSLACRCCADPPNCDKCDKPSEEKPSEAFIRKELASIRKEGLLPAAKIPRAPLRRRKRSRRRSRTPQEGDSPARPESVAAEEKEDESDEGESVAASSDRRW